MKDQEIIKQIAVLKQQIEFLEKLLTSNESKEAQTPKQWFKEYLQDVTRDGDFFKKDGEIVMEQDGKSGYLWVSYSKIWLVFYDKFQLKYHDVQSLIKTMVEEHFNCKVETPNIAV